MVESCAQGCYSVAYPYVSRRRSWPTLCRGFLSWPTFFVDIVRCVIADAAVPPLPVGRIAVVVPCFNEAERLDVDGFTPFVMAGVDVLFVDDGSTDGTAALLDQLAASATTVSTVHLPCNVGKAEAVRTGLLAAIDAEATIVGYLDADLATSAGEFMRLIDHLDERSGRQVVLGSRVALLGHHIERRMWRHYTGRVFATGASIVLGMPVYDTQCGAKAFRVSPALRDALAEPFSSKWSFDVELLGRLERGSQRCAGMTMEAFLEVPLDEWHDQPGGKLGVGASIKATAELPKIAWKIRHR